jgi:hypothetical protein
MLHFWDLLIQQVSCIMGTYEKNSNQFNESKIFKNIFQNSCNLLGHYVKGCVLSYFWKILI